MIITSVTYGVFAALLAVNSILLLTGKSRFPLARYESEEYRQKFDIKKHIIFLGVVFGIEAIALGIEAIYCAVIWPEIPNALLRWTITLTPCIVTIPCIFLFQVVCRKKAKE